MASTTNSHKYTEQEVLNLIVDDTTNGLTVTQGTKIAGEDLTNDVLKVEQRFTYTNITTNATTTVKTGSGYVDHITINNPALITVANLTVTVYDNTAGSGTKVGTWTVPFGLTTQVPFDIPIRMTFSTGLTVVTAGPTVTGDLTVGTR